jgi:hypothetical protein
MRQIATFNRDPDGGRRTYSRSAVFTGVSIFEFLFRFGLCRLRKYFSSDASGKMLAAR